MLSDVRGITRSSISTGRLTTQYPFGYYRLVKIKEEQWPRIPALRAISIHERTTGEEREKMIEVTKADIIKKFGDGAIMRYGDGGPEPR